MKDSTAIQDWKFARTELPNDGDMVWISVLGLTFITTFTKAECLGAKYSTDDEISDYLKHKNFWWQHYITAPPTTVTIPLQLDKTKHGSVTRLLADSGEMETQEFWANLVALFGKSNT